MVVGMHFLYIPIKIGSRHNDQGNCRSTVPIHHEQDGNEKHLLTSLRGMLENPCSNCQIDCDLIWICFFFFVVIWYLFLVINS